MRRPLWSALFCIFGMNHDCGDDGSNQRNHDCHAANVSHCAALGSNPPAGFVCQIYDPIEHIEAYEHRAGHGQTLDPAVLYVDNCSVEVGQFRRVRRPCGACRSAARHIHDIIQRQIEAYAYIAHGEDSGVGGLPVKYAFDGGSAYGTGGCKLVW